MQLMSLSHGISKLIRTHQLSAELQSVAGAMLGYLQLSLLLLLLAWPCRRSAPSSCSAQGHLQQLAPSTLLSWEKLCVSV